MSQTQIARRQQAESRDKSGKAEVQSRGAEAFCLTMPVAAQLATARAPKLEEAMGLMATELNEANERARHFEERVQELEAGGDDAGPYHPQLTKHTTALVVFC